MSQSGILTESELPGYIHQHLGLKLDKEALARPTRDVVTEIYTRFLDKTVANWKIPKNPDLEFPMAQMLGWLRLTFSRYNIEFEFSMSDLIEPTKKRTIIFLNVLLLNIAQSEIRWNKWQEWKAHWAEKQEETAKVKMELEKSRMRREELALAKGESKSVAELDKLIAAMREKFEAEDKKGAKLRDELAAAKENIDYWKNANQHKLTGCQEIEAEIKRMGQVMGLEDRNSRLQNKLTTLRRELEELKLTAGIKENRLKADLEKKRNEKTELKQRIETEVEKLKTEVMEIDKRLADIATRQKHRSEATKALVDKANRKLEALENRAEESKQLSQKGLAALANYRSKYEILFGLNKAEQTEVPMNRTFIKSTANV